MKEQVKQVHAVLWEQPSYSRYFAAEVDADAVEGAVSFDMFLATRMISEQAAKMGMRELAAAKLATILDALIELGVLSRRQIAALEAAEAEAQRFRFELRGVKPN
jgi:hypothetical protein